MNLISKDSKNDKKVCKKSLKCINKYAIRILSSMTSQEDSNDHEENELKRSRFKASKQNKLGFAKVCNAVN